MTKTYFRECRWLILIYSFMEANRNNCRFSGISHHLFFSGYVDGPIYNWILFHNKYRLRQLLNMNTCTIFTQQRMCRCFLCWIFSLSPSRSLPRLIPSLVCVRGDRPLGTNSMDSLNLAASWVWPLGNPGWISQRVKLCGLFPSLPDCCCSFCISLWKTPAPAREGGLLCH